MAGRRRFQVQLTPTDVVDYDLEVSRGKVLSFSLSYRSLEGERWLEVIRYDTDHGHLHVHRGWLRGPEAVEALEDPRRPSPDYRAALAAAERDIRDHWERYRDLVEASLR